VTTPERGTASNTPRLRFSLGDMRIPARDPGPGDQVPTFDLPTTDGRRLSSEESAVDGRPVLLVLGSLTCPITQGAGAGIRDLHNRYGDRVRFVFVSVREAHPGAMVGQPGTMDEKLSNAALLKTHHGFNFDVAVDDIDGTFHRSLGPRPSSAYTSTPPGRSSSAPSGPTSRPRSMRRSRRSQQASGHPSPTCARPCGQWRRWQGTVRWRSPPPARVVYETRGKWPPRWPQ
jgi:hypothetical protein